MIDVVAVGAADAVAAEEAVAEGQEETGAEIGQMTAAVDSGVGVDATAAGTAGAGAAGASEAEVEVGTTSAAISRTNNRVAISVKSAGETSL